MKWLKRAIRQWLDLVSVRAEFVSALKRIGELEKRVGTLESAYEEAKDE